MPSEARSPDDRTPRPPRLARAAHAALQATPATVAWAAVVVFVLFSIGAPLLGRGIFLGTDVLTRYAPWLDSHPETLTLTNNWIGDTIDFYAPQTTLLAESVRAGDIAWWNPYIIGGTPLGALPDTGLFSPITWVWLVLPASYAAGAMKLVEMTVAVVGMALFTRRLGMSSAAQAVAGLAYISGGFMVAWTNWPHTRIAALVPLLFWATDRVLSERRIRDAAPLALVVAGMLLTGFPSVLGFAIYGVLAFAVIRLMIMRTSLRGWLRSAGIGVLGAGLGALLSAWQLVPWGLHALTTIDFGARAQDAWRHLDWTAAASAVAPGLIGDPGDIAHSFWISGANPIESFAYVGIGAVTLIVAALVLRGHTRLNRAIGWFALAGAATCATLIFQGGWLLGLFQELPVFSNNSVTRLRFLLGFFLALAAATGIDRVLHLARLSPRTTTAKMGEVGDIASADQTIETTSPEEGRRTPAWVTAISRWMLAAGFCIALCWLVLTAYHMVPDEFATVERRGVIATALIGGGLLALLLAAALIRWRPLGITAVVAVCVVLVAQGLSVTRDWWPTSEESTFFSATPTHDFLNENLGHDRYLGIGWTMLTGTSSAYEQRSVTGHGFHTPEWKALLEEIDDDAMLTRTYSQLSWDAARSPVLDRMGVRYLVDSPDVQPPGEIEAVGVTETETRLAGSVTTATLTGPIRAVQVTPPGDGAIDEDLRLVVRILDAANGEVLAETSRSVASMREATVWLAVPGEQISTDQSVQIQAEIQGVTEVTWPTNAAGEWTTAIVRPTDDDLTVVHGGDTTIYLRENAAPRIRWASNETVIEDEDDRLAAIASGKFPPDTVILENAATAQILPGGSTADLDILEDGGVIRVRVDADGAGWLVFAESVRGGGWTATIDGRDAELVNADEAMGGVYLPGGEHEVTISYHPPGFTLGVVGSIMGAITVIVLVAAPPLLKRRREVVE